MALLIMRLDKFLADLKYGTRSEVKTLIKKGHIQINDEIIKKADYKVDESTIVYVDGEPVQYVQYEYYLLNKPAGYLSATEDLYQPVVMELIDSRRKDLAPVGRLDKDTEGVLLISNDGQLAHQLLSPKYHVEKTYYAKLDAPMPENAVDLFAQPMEFEEFTSSPAKLEPICDTEAYLTIHEGKFHQVKRMFEKVGCTVTYLERIRFDCLTLDGLERGDYRELSQDEIKTLKKADY